MQLRHHTTTTSTSSWPQPPAACVRRCNRRPQAASHRNHHRGMQAHSSSSSSHLRRGGVAPLRSLPEDQHHQPQETPEAWLLAQQHAERANKLQKEAAAAGGSSSSHHHHQGGQRKLMVPYLGLEVTPELVAISMVYFVQGILGLSRLALSFFFKDDLGVEPAQVAVLTGLAGLPWVVKPVYGFISDSIPLFGYRRRSYLLLCGVAGSVSWLSLATLVHSPTAAVSAMLLGSLSTACSDVVVDSLVVERARGEPAATAGSLQSLCWGSSAVGGILSAYFSGSLVEQFGSQTVFALTAIFPLIVSASALLIDEQRVGSRQSPSQQLPPAVEVEAVVVDAGNWQQQRQQRQQQEEEEESKQLLERLPAASSSSSSSSWSSGLSKQLVAQGAALWGAVKQKHILLPTVFVFLWQATPTADTAMFYFYTNQLHFTPEFLGRVRLAGSIASLAGVALYNGVFKAVPLKKMLLAAMLLGVGLGSTQLLLVSGANRTLGLSDELFVLGDSVILTVLGQVSFMPILVLAARLCPEGVEATLFATLMSILNGGSFVGSALGAGLTAYLGVSSTDFSNLFLLVLLCNFSTLLPAPFLGLLPSSLDGQDSTPAADPAAAAAEFEVAVAAGGSSGSGSKSNQRDAGKLTGGSSNSDGAARSDAATNGGAGVRQDVEGGGLSDEQLPLKSGRRK